MVNKALRKAGVDMNKAWNTESMWKAVRKNKKISNLAAKDRRIIDRSFKNF